MSRAGGHPVRRVAFHREGRKLWLSKHSQPALCWARATGMRHMTVSLFSGFFQLGYVTRNAKAAIAQFQKQYQAIEFMDVPDRGAPDHVSRNRP